MNISCGIGGRLVCVVGLAATLAMGCDDEDPGPVPTTGTAGSGGQTGSAGSGGSGGAAGNAGSGGNAGSTGGAGTTGSAGATGSAGSTGGAGTTGSAGSTGGGGTTGTAGNYGQSATMTAGRFAGVMVETYSADVRAAQIAKSRSSNGQVLSFADTMITDRWAATMQLQQLLADTKSVVEDSAHRQSLSSHATQTLDMLSTAPAASFDTVYIDSQIASHTMTLQMLDRLSPAGQDTDVATQLQASRTAAASSLAQAQQIRSALPQVDTAP